MNPQPTGGEVDFPARRVRSRSNARVVKQYQLTTYPCVHGLCI